MEFNEVIKARKSVRKFKSTKPNWKDIIEAIDWASKIPYAGGIHNIKFILIDNKKKINDIGDYCQQDFVSKAHYVVAVVSDLKDLTASYEERGEKYALEQGGAAVNQFLLKLVDLGLDGCWVGSFDDEQMKRILKIPEKTIIHAVIPIGYGLDDSKRKRRPNIDRILRFNNYKETFMIPKKKPEAF